MNKPTPSDGYALVERPPYCETPVQPGDQFWSCIDQTWKDSEVKTMSRGHYYQRPIADAAPSESRPIAEFDAKAHLPCWVFSGGVVDIACIERAEEGQPESFNGTTRFDDHITHFLPVKKPALAPISPERQAVDKWWERLAEKPTDIETPPMSNGRTTSATPTATRCGASGMPHTSSRTPPVPAFRYLP